MQNQQPNSEESEKALVGLTLLDGHMPQGSRQLAVTDFYSPIYRNAWRAFAEQDADGQEIDALATYEIMKRNDPGITERYAASELVNTTTGIPVRTNEMPFVNRIKEMAVKRFLIRELHNQADALATESGPEVILRLKRTLDEIGGIASSTGHFRPLSEIMEKEVIPALEALGSGFPPTTKIPLGFPSIDNFIGGGMSTSDILLIAGLPGSGKSALVLQIARNIAEQGIPIAFLSGEMGNTENIFRMLSQVSKFSNLNSVMHLDRAEIDMLTEWANAIKLLPMFFDSTTSDVQTIGRAIRSMVMTHGIKALVIDYIQLLKLGNISRHSRTERIAEVSQEVKRVAMECGIAIIEVAQFNREGAKSGRPTMSDLEGSSQLEKDASLIFIVDRQDRGQEVALRIEKGRNSGLGELAGRFIGPWLTFEF